ncbi:MAG: ZPR1 zinc finger domain-containing protein [Candidatus Woesearchaeota archaeon]|nr:ZPR1 zinc finger domain-containing protein [Candidatus Woesearchaeota archaeon]
MDEELQADVLEGETCPICGEKELTLMETSRDVAFFGICHLFSMNCKACKYHKADIEAETQQKESKFTLEIEGEEDLKARVVKSSTATIKIPHVGSIESGETSNGYISNVEGVITRIKQQVEHLKEAADDPKERKKAKNMLKKIQKILWGQEKAKIILEDKAGNSAIISPKAVKK